MPSPSPTEVLKALLLGEQRNLAGRLLESTLFVSRLGVEASIAVRDMVQSSAEHCGWLAGMILDAGDSPSPPMPDVRSGDLHFQDLGFVLSRLAEDIQRRIDMCSRAAQHLAQAPRAAALVGKIADRHRSALSDLRELCAEGSVQTQA